MIFRLLNVLLLTNTALLAGCAASQPPIVGPGTMPQSRAIATYAARGGSWMLPGASSDDLLYATGGCGGTCVLSYPDGTLVGSLNVNGVGACVDTSENVYITYDSNIFEYAHGGTTPINTLSLPGSGAWGCAIDPSTGNLAVAFEGSNVSVAIFSKASGSPQTYKTPVGSYSCGYDDQGNLFVGGTYGEQAGLAELPLGASSFKNISVPAKLGDPGQVQWDGTYLSYEGVSKAEARMARLKISGAKGTIVSLTHYKVITGYAYLSTIYAGDVIIPYSRPSSRGFADRISAFKYPHGSRPLFTFKHIAQPKPNFQAVAVSSAI